jgi:hypothetical protein
MLKLSKKMAVASLLYWRENWNVQKELEKRTDIQKIKYLRSVAEYVLHNNQTNK